MQRATRCSQRHDRSAVSLFPDALHQGEYLKAAAEYTKALKTDAGDADVLAALHSNRSACFARLSKASRALDDADAALKARPGWEKAHYRRAVALDLLSRPAEALAALQLAVVDGAPPSADVVALRKKLSGAPPPPPRPQPPPAADAAASSSFRFKPEATGAAAVSASWVQPGAPADEFVAALASGSTLPPSLRKQFASARASSPGCCSAASFASSFASCCASAPSAWPLLPLLVRSVAPGPHRVAARAALEAYRGASRPGAAMPLQSDDAASLLSAATCASECPQLRADALVAANAAVLEAAKRPQGLFGRAPSSDVAASLLRSGLADACLAAVAPSTKAAVDAGAAALVAAGAGTFWNACAHARRAAATSPAPARSGAAERHARLCSLLDRTPNPLENVPSDGDEWDAAASHAFLAPIAALLSCSDDDAVLASWLLRADALDAATAAHSVALSGLLVMAELRRCAGEGGAPGVARLAEWDAAASFAAEVARLADAYSFMATAVADLGLQQQRREPA